MLPQKDGSQCPTESQSQRPEDACQSDQERVAHDAEPLEEGRKKREEGREEGRDGRKEEEMKVERDEVSQKDEGKGEERRKEEKKGTRGTMRNLSELQYWPTMCLLIRLPELSGLCSSIYTTDELQPKNTLHH